MKCYIFFFYFDFDLLNVILVSGNMWVFSIWKVEISFKVIVCKLISEYIWCFLRILVKL